MAMIFIGSNLVNYKFSNIIKSLTVIESSLMKLVWLPALTGVLVYFLPLSSLIKSILVLGACFPTAATVSMLAEQEGLDPGPASKVLFLSTVASKATVPAAINLINMIFV